VEQFLDVRLRELAVSALVRELRQLNRTLRAVSELAVGLIGAEEVRPGDGVEVEDVALGHLVDLAEGRFLRLQTSPALPAWGTQSLRRDLRDACIAGFQLSDYLAVGV